MSEQMARLNGMLKSLNLKGMMGCYLELAERAAQSKLGYEEYLCLLLEEELKGKTDRSVTSKIHKARFPFIKNLEEFDFSFQPGLGEKEVLRLGSLEFIENKENLVFLGPSGVGKTHLSIGFGGRVPLIQPASGGYHAPFR